LKNFILNQNVLKKNIENEYLKKIINQMEIPIINNFIMNLINVLIILIIYLYELMIIIQVYNVRIVVSNKNHCREVYRKSQDDILIIFLIFTFRWKLIFFFSFGFVLGSVHLNLSILSHSATTSNNNKWSFFSELSDNVLYLGRCVIENIV